MQRENLLVRYIAKVSTDQGDIEKIKEILSSRPINWAYFFDRIRSEGIVSLVYKSLLGIDYAKTVVPEDIWARLESSYYTVAARNTLLYEKLDSILNCLNQAKIEVIILKGMALAGTIYPDIALRPMFDIDILIRKDDFSSVEDRLRGLGYINSPSYPEDFYKGNMMVDVHWDLLNITRVKSRKKSCQIDIDEIWKSSRLIGIGGYEVRVLSPEHCLMDLCLHLSLHHGLSGLIWLIDVARFIEYYRDKIDWNKFIDSSFEYKIYKPVYYTLCYAKEILGQQIPPSVLDGLRPKRQSLLERRIFDLISSGVSLENIRFFFTLSTMEGFLDRLTFLREIGLPSPRVLCARYNISSVRYLPQCYLIHLKYILSSIFKLLQRISLAYF